MPPEEESPVRRKAIVFTVVAVVILAGGLIGAVLALKRAQKMVGKQPAAVPAKAPPAEAANPFAAQGFRVSAITVEKTSGRKLAYAQGSVFNTSTQQRFGVKIELDLFDAEGKWVANASDYTGNIEPNAEWKFRAPVIQSKAVSAKVASIKETK
jgi:hypothetical protein